MAKDPNGSAHPIRTIVVAMDPTEMRGLVALADQVEHSGVFDQLSLDQRDAVLGGLSKIAAFMEPYRGDESVNEPPEVSVHLSPGDLAGLTWVARSLGINDVVALGASERESADMMAAIDELKSALDDAVWLN
ncbi:MAG: hypothetical protein AAGI44_01490 [Pseudomonadota bacterium]